MENRKDNRGGSRPGSGRKRSRHQTEVLTFRVRSEWAYLIRSLVKDKLHELSVESLGERFQ